MNIIVFDMEWNMGYPKTEAARFDEIIEIGAAKVEGGQIVDTYKEYVRPTFHHVIHHHVRKMLPFTKQDLRDAKNFRTVVREFKNWCGPDAQLVSWGNSDISVLHANLEKYHMPSDWFGDVYDLQAGYAYLLGEYTHQYALKDVVEQLGIDAPEEFHDAANDAYYTALIGIAIGEKYGELPSTQVIQAKREELRAIRAEELRIKAKEQETAALEEASPLSWTKLGSYPNDQALLQSGECSKWPCPHCGSPLSATGWTVYAETGYITRGQCKEHGWTYAYVTTEPEEGGHAVHGARVIYPATQRLKSTYFRFGHSGRKKGKK
jgi:DNA polymerase III epsilon subunit-like protein